MSENKFSAALVHELCPICGKAMNEQIIINSRLTKKDADNVRAMNGKAIRYSSTCCEDCIKYKDKVVICIIIDEELSDKNNPYRTGEIIGVDINCNFVKQAKDFIITTGDGVKFLFIDKEAAKQINLIQ